MTTVYPHIKEALGISSAAGYAQLSQSWSALTAQWNAAYPDQCDSTIAFSLIHPGGRAVKDSLILIKDQSAGAAPAVGPGADMAGEAQAVINVKSAIENRQPIQNNVTPSSVSFYVNYPEFIKTYPHSVQIQVNSGCPEIAYHPISYLVIANQTGAIRPNEFLYAKIYAVAAVLGNLRGDSSESKSRRQEDLATHADLTHRRVGP